MPDATQSPGATGSWGYRALIVSIALSAAGYLALSVWAGWRDLFDAVSSVGLAGTAIAFGLSLVNYVLRFVRWQRYLQLLGHKVPWRPSIRIYMAGFALTTTPAKAGELVRSVFLKRFGIKHTESGAAFFAERLSDLIAILLITAIGVSSHAAARPWVIGVTAIIFFILLTLHNHRWLDYMESLGRQLRWRRARELWVSLIDLVVQFRRLFGLPVMAYSTVLSVIAWAAEAQAFYLVASWMGANITFAEAWFIYGFAALVGALSFIPGGLGSTEVVMVGLLLLAGMPEPQAIACTLFIRVATLWFAVALGLIALPPRSPLPIERAP